jgi:hypothetical protein
MFTKARHWTLSWARWIQCTSSHPISYLCSIIIISSHQRSCLPNVLSSSGFSTKMYAFLIYAIRNPVTTQRRVLHKALIVTQLLKKYPMFSVMQDLLPSPLGAVLQKVIAPMLLRRIMEALNHACLDARSCDRCTVYGYLQKQSAKWNLCRTIRWQLLRNYSRCWRLLVSFSTHQFQENLKLPFFMLSVIV